MDSNIVIASHQPNFLPWKGFFKKMSEADIFIILDNVQFARRSYTQRTKLPFENDIWISVPVKKKGRYNQKINEVEIDYSVHWLEKHIRTFQHYFRGLPHFEEVYPKIEAIYKKNYRYLIELNMEFIRFIMEYLDIKKELLFSSRWMINGKKEERILNILERTGGNTYLSGMGGKKYLHPERFINRGYNVIFKDFGKDAPIYSIIYEMFLKGKDALDR